MTPDTSKARNLSLRSLIEEARDLVVNHECDQADAKDIDAAVLLMEALTLLPEWQEFDPKREETWPKEELTYLVAFKDGSYGLEHWEDVVWDEVAAWMPLPPPHEK